MVCAAIGLCQSQQAALAKAEAKEQLMSNEIPNIDLSQRGSPFLVNVPLLLYPQESPKQEAPKQVHCFNFLLRSHEQHCVLQVFIWS